MLLWLHNVGFAGGGAAVEAPSGKSVSDARGGPDNSEITIKGIHGSWDPWPSNWTGPRPEKPKPRPEPVSSSKDDDLALLLLMLLED